MKKSTGGLSEETSGKPYLGVEEKEQTAISP